MKGDLKMIWSADIDEKTYRNPIIYEDYSDPDVCRGRDAYYMTASSFSFVPGLPVLKSYDLVHWDLVNYALRKIPEFRYREPLHGCGVWAPAIRFCNETYYIIFPMPDEGLYMTWTKNPEGEWSGPVKIYDGAGLIDPCPFFNEDGRVYLVNGVAKSRIGYKSVLMMSELSKDLTRIIYGPVKIYDGNEDGNVTIEGPKLYRRKGFYYIFAPAGGVKTGWQTVLRSRNLYSGWEPHISMCQGTTGINGPHQGALIADGAGNDFFLHFQDVFAAGRITHLQPVTWLEGAEGEWPVIGKPISGGDACGEPVLSSVKPCPIDVTDSSGKVAPQTNKKTACEPSAPAVSLTGENKKSVTGIEKDEDNVNTYNGLNPPLPWQWNCNPEEEWLSVPSSGKIRLQSVPAPKERPLVDIRNLFLRRVSAPELDFSAVLDMRDLPDGGYAGICLSGMSYGGIGIHREGDAFFVRNVTGHQVFDCGAAYADERIEEVPFTGRADRFRVSVQIRNVNGITAVSDKPVYGPGDEDKVLHPEEEVTLSIGPETGLPEGRKYSITLPMEAGRWTGAKYGFFVISEIKHRIYEVFADDVILK